MLAHRTTVPESSLLRSPKASEGQGGALGEAEARRRGNTVGVRDQVMDLVAAQGEKVSRIAVLPTPMVSDQFNADLKSTQQKDGSMHSVTLAQIMHRPDLLPFASDLLPTPRAQEPGSTSPGYGDGLNDVANRIVNGFAAKDLLPTPKARDGIAEGYEAGLRRASPQVGTVVRAIVDGDERIFEQDVAEEQLQLLPTPTAVDGNTVAKSELDANDPKHRLKVAVQVLARDAELALLPTPTTMEHREIKSEEEIAELKAKSPGGYRNLREEVIHQLLPTTTASDWKGANRSGSGSASANGLSTTVDSLLPTPKALDGVKGNLKTSEERIANGNYVDLPNVAQDLVLIGTPRATRAASTKEQVEAEAPKGRIEDQVLLPSWGKFEPAIRRWEMVIGRAAPAPTKPDGKDGAHRLSSEFTEWMMGLEQGWVTSCGLTRNEELKACGNGVVPQQAELALRMLLDGVSW